MFRRLPALLALFAGIMLLTGCGSKFNRENFNMVRIGTDDREDVRHMLGSPDADFGDVWMYDDADGYKTAQIYFDEDGRVLNKEWMDARSGEWSGENPRADKPPKGEMRESETRTRRIDDD